MIKDRDYFLKKYKKSLLLNNEFKFRYINGMLNEDNFLKRYYSFQQKLNKELYI